MITPDLPLYVERVNFAIVPPARLEDATLYVFPIPSRLDRQQHLCEVILNAPSNGVCDYRALHPFVVLIFARYERVEKAVYPPGVGLSVPWENENSGYARYHAAGISIFMVNANSRDDDKELVLFPFCTFVDHGASISGTRELQGWSTETAKLQIPEADDLVGGKFILTCPVIKTFGPNSMATVEKLIQLEKVSERTAKPIENSFRDSLTAIWENALSTAADYLTIWLVSLKQFPDVAHPTRACYQAGVETNVESPKNKGRRWSALEGRYQLRILAADSHPLIAELGLDVEAFSGLEGFCLRADEFRVNPGKELWRAP
jgi:hypothetical protein